MCNPVRLALARWDDPEAREAMSALRRAVFIVEQRVPEELEWDGRDENAVHVLARDSHGTPIGTARMLRDGHIGRVAVRTDWRTCGVGSALVLALVEEARRRGLAETDLDAQVHAVAFYERLGFVAEGPEFLDAGIPHRHMRRTS